MDQQNRRSKSSDSALETMWTSERMLTLRSRRRAVFGRLGAIFVVAWAIFIGWPALAPSSYGTIVVPGLSLGMIVCGLYVITCFSLTIAYVRAARGWDVLAADMARTHGLDFGTDDLDDGVQR
ncbi:DUF485 domain-containing protein [Rhodococcus sp. 15-649-1-2]|nr:DUF485 domain-containing protein [Rhodococcus sp. 15-649-1-2]